MNLVYQHRRGCPEGRPITIAINARLTVPVREALCAAGAEVQVVGTTERGATLYSVRLAEDRVVPAGIVACQVVGEGGWCLRMSDEQEYPGEVYEYWVTLDFQPCPQCGRPLIWYEAGYAPGYRVCTGRARHHVQAIA